MMPGLPPPGKTLSKGIGQTSIVIGDSYVWSRVVNETGNLQLSRNHHGGTRREKKKGRITVRKGDRSKRPLKISKRDFSFG